jgi:hypothetical protein
LNCPVCLAPSVDAYSSIEGVQYFECGGCGSLFANPQFLAQVDAGTVKNYSSDYWKMEVNAAKERSFGSSPARVAEVFLYCRIPIDNFVDVGTGPGFLLDAISMLMPASKNIFHAVEMFPPPEEFRSTHPNFFIGSVDDMPIKFDAGTCIEVIEHLTPLMLDRLVRQLADRSNPGATYYFGSGQPCYVKMEDPAYLDPHRRGHIVSWSLSGITPIFAKHGFNVIPLPGRDWAFLAEMGELKSYTPDALLSRIWSAVPQNVARLKDPEFGPMMYSMGIESARCYLESAISANRALWAQSLVAKIEGKI